MTQSAASEPLRHPLLQAAGVAHGFGTRASAALAPTLLARARQIHGAAVATADAAGGISLAEADAVVCCEPGVAAAVVTADCVPILACTDDGRCVVAIHAGWRGLAEGVIEAGVAALRNSGPVACESSQLRAVIGPHIGPCCYEVDDAVLEPLQGRFADVLDGAICATRPGHALLDLAVLAQSELARSGVVAAKRAVIEDACTRCDSQRFHSYRRDGSSAGRLLHYVVPRGLTGYPAGSSVA